MTIQSFNVQGGPETGRNNVPKLRAHLRKIGLDGFFIPHDDAYLNEYLPAAYERLMWVSGFSGSAGAAFVLADRAAVFSDGRYTLQLETQTDLGTFERVEIPKPGLDGWLASQDLPGHRIGYDPRLMTPTAVAKLKIAAKKAGALFVAVDENPIDQIWIDQPPLPHALLRVQDERYAGESHTDKRNRIGMAVHEAGADAVVITSPASIAWLFNIRGEDVACTPLPLARAILFAKGHAELFVEPIQLTDHVREHLGHDVKIRPLDKLEVGLKQLAGKSVALDKNSASVWFHTKLEDSRADIIDLADPVQKPRACKNATEINGMKAAHLRDGVALTNFLHWLDTSAQTGDIDEITAVETLEAFRHDTGALRDISFETISGAGPNGAIVHYRVSTDTNRKLEKGSLFLVDSGGQYVDGTTDVTRTIAIGKPSDEMRTMYTRVLKGHIALTTIRFPEETSGTHLDILARQFLWRKGQDYAHGTGHGVGAYLGVHEGPQSIARKWNNTYLEPGMVVSNEPGYYKKGEYGIRIENLQFVTPPAHIDGGDRAMFGFEALTLAPYARTLIDKSLLTPDEIAFVDTYHARVLHNIGPDLDAPVTAWLETACAAL